MGAGNGRPDARRTRPPRRVAVAAAWLTNVVPEAWLLAALGELDAACVVLARAEDECQANLYFTGFPTFDALRADPRLAALLVRLGLPVQGARQS